MRSEHIAPVLRELHRLSAQQWITFKTAAVLVQKGLRALNWLPCTDLLGSILQVPSHVGRSHLRLALTLTEAKYMYLVSRLNMRLTVAEKVGIDSTVLAVWATMWKIANVQLPLSNIHVLLSSSSGAVLKRHSHCALVICQSAPGALSDQGQYDKWHWPWKQFRLVFFGAGVLDSNPTNRV